MRRWFLSYHSPDQALAERLKAAIERKDSGARVVFAPANMRAGGFWSEQLAQELADATAFVLVVGERGLGDWQKVEYREAFERRVKSPDFPVILVLLEGQTAPGLPFLRQLHWIVTPDPASEKGVTELLDAASGSSAGRAERWRYTTPYRGLAAMEEKDSDYFFGRERETVEVLNLLAETSDRIPVLLGNSGVGKSSIAQAGVLATLRRQAWPEGTHGAGAWPLAFMESRKWCFLTMKPGTEPLRALVEPFIQTWQFDPTDPRRETRRTEWIENLQNGRNTLSGLLDATEDRLQQRGQSKPAKFFLYVDQGEELYVRSEKIQHRRFSELVAQGLSDSRLAALMSMRSDFLGHLQIDEPLFAVHRKIDVPPLRETELREVISKPASLLGARFATDNLADDIARRTAEESTTDASALPLLSYFLDDMWKGMVEQGDGILRAPERFIELGRVLVDRANAFIARHPNSEDKLRRIFTLKLATVREGQEPTRRRAWRSEFSEDEWLLVTELADDPNRLLVTGISDAGVTPEVSPTTNSASKVEPSAGEGYAEVAHEVIFRRWEKLRQWVTNEREFLAWRSGLEAARLAWQATPKQKRAMLLTGRVLTQAVDRLKKRRADISKVDQDFIIRSRNRRRLIGWASPLLVILFAYSTPLSSYIRDKIWPPVSVVSGAGSDPCNVINSSASPGMGPEQNTVTMRIFSWIQGYMSGFNRSKQEVVFDVGAFTSQQGVVFDVEAFSPEIQWELIQSYCQAHPAEPIERAIQQRSILKR
jgi:hypothetical protein